MFSKLRQQRFTTKKSPSPSKPPLAPSRSPVTKQRSYSRLQKQKQNNSQLFDYQIAWICDHLYQGCFVNNQKHGQGIQIMSNGIVAVGQWKRGKMDGYAIFLTPFGGKAHVNFKNGVLEGWTILEYRDNFMLTKYSNDMPDSIRYRYDQSEQSWTQAIYTYQNKVQKILSITHSPNYTLPNALSDPSIVTLFQQLIMKCKTKLKQNKLSTIKISDKFEYYGYTNTDKTPHGLGIIYSSNEIYAGNFKNGALDQYGMILFQNGVMYKGEIYAGKIWGDGIIYDVNLDQSKIVRVCQEGVEYVVDQEDGFCIESIPFKIGKIPKMSDDRGFSNAVQPLFEEITKYYYRSNSSIIEEESSKHPNSSPDDDNYSNNYSINSQPEQPVQTRLEKRQRLKQASPTPAQATTAKKTVEQPAPTITIPIEPYPPLRPPTPPSSHNSSKKSTHNRLPSFAPSFEQITHSALNRTKPLYPYLLEFQISKNIFSPYKFSKIGKIVANSVKIAQKHMF